MDNFTNRNIRKMYRDATRTATLKARTRRVKEAVKFKKAKTKLKQASRENALESSNPIKRRLAERRELANKKREVKLRKLEADAKVAELNPKITSDRMKADNAIKVEQARYRSKTASATAYATGAAALGRGLSDENNQDDQSRQANELAKIQTIFGPQSSETHSDDGTGLKQGVE